MGENFHQNQASLKSFSHCRKNKPESLLIKNEGETVKSFSQKLTQHFYCISLVILVYREDLDMFCFVLFFNLSTWPLLKR